MVFCVGYVVCAMNGYKVSASGSEQHGGGIWIAYMIILAEYSLCVFGSFVDININVCSIV